MSKCTGEGTGEQAHAGVPVRGSQRVQEGEHGMGQDETCVLPLWASS